MDKQNNLDSTNAIALFIQNNRGIIFGVLGFSLMTLIGLAVYGLISYNNALSAAAMVDRAVIRFEYYKELSQDDPKREETKTEFLNILKKFTESKTEAYAGAKALWTMAEFEGLQQNTEKQIEYLQRLLEWYPETHRDIEATYQLANLFIKTGQTEDARVLLETLMNKSNLPTLYREEILFMLGGLAESTDKAKAIEIFKKLVDTYPLSEWTKLARSRILLLELQS